MVTFRNIVSQVVSSIRVNPQSILTPLLAQLDLHIKEAGVLFILKPLSTDLAKRLGITDRQARRIKTGKVGEARIREHAKRDRDQQKEGCRLRPRRARAALLLLAGASAKAA